MHLLDLLFPKNCLECKKSGSYICNTCLAKVEKARLICPVCKRYGFNGKAHSICASKHSLDGMYSFYKYDGVIRKVILAIKYKFAYSAAKDLIEKVEITSNEFSSDSVVIPIPLHVKRERWRGFNQAEILGKLIAEKNSWDFIKKALVRLENTTPQVKLDKQERMQNIRGKFAVNKEFTPDSNKTYIIFDDVWTTGSTISEACKVLKKAGTKNVWGMNVART